MASGGWGRLRGDSEAVGIAWLLLSSLLVAFLPNTAKLAYAGGSNAATLLLLRGFIGVGLLGLALVLAGKSISLPRWLILPSLLAGAGAAGFVYGFYNAIVTIEVGLAMLIVYIYPVLIGLYEHVLGRMRIGVFWAGWSVVALSGLALTLAADLASFDPTGFAFAALGMLSITLATLVNMSLVREVGVLRSNFYLTLWTLPIFAGALLLSGDPQLPTTGLGWLGVVGNGTAATAAWITFVMGAKIIGAARASMITIVEPLLAAGMAFLLFGEWLSALQWTGFAVVLVALFALESPQSLRDRLSGKRPL